MQVGQYKNVCVKIDKEGDFDDRNILQRFIEVLNVLSEVYHINIKCDITISKTRPQLKLVCPQRSVN